MRRSLVALGLVALAACNDSDSAPVSPSGNYALTVEFSSDEAKITAAITCTTTTDCLLVLNNVDGSVSHIRAFASARTLRIEDTQPTDDRTCGRLNVTWVGTLKMTTDGFSGRVRLDRSPTSSCSATSALEKWTATRS
jgi:hypothetical protein